MTTTERTRGDALAEDVAERQRAMLRLTDDELVQKAYDLALFSEDNHVDPDEWYVILGEVFERFAPEAELRNFERSYRDEPDRLDAEINIASAREYFYRRQAARIAYQAERVDA